MSGAVVRARGASKRFGRAVALRELDLDVAAGESLALLGPNGAGKSTLLRLLAGLARPSAGCVEIDGLAATHRTSRGASGYLAHATLLAPELTVRENLIFAGRLHGVARPGERADALLREEELEALAERRTAALSRGQAQRVAIARSLVHDPPLLLLDEPFTGLDRGAARRLASRLGELRGRGRTLVLVTHDTEHLGELADAALVLAAGQAFWQGPIGNDLERALQQALSAGERAA